MTLGSDCHSYYLYGEPDTWGEWSQNPQRRHGARCSSTQRADPAKLGWVSPRKCSLSLINFSQQGKQVTSRTWQKQWGSGSPT